MIPLATVLSSDLSRALRALAPSAVKRCVAMVCAAAAPLLAASLALAAEEAAHEGGAAPHGNPWMDLLWKAINVAILIGIIWWAARKPVAAAMKNAAKTTRDAFMSSRKAAQDMEAQMAEQKRKITQLAQELSHMVADAKADVEREKQRAQADAKALGVRLQQQTEQQIEQEVAKARNTLRQELADQTVKLAEQLVKQKVNAEEQKRLVANYLKQLEARP
jgi:F-type H+-transporting ATPase subunit b